MSDALDAQLLAMGVRADAASAGPWHTDEDDFDGHAVHVTETGWQVGVRIVAQQISQGHDEGAADAAFIAHARTDVPRLLDAVDFLLGTVSQLAATLDTGFSDHPSKGDQVITATRAHTARLLAGWDS